MWYSPPYDKKILLFHSDAVIWREDFRVKPANSLSFLAWARFSSSELFSARGFCLPICSGLVLWCLALNSSMHVVSSHVPMSCTLFSSSFLLPHSLNMAASPLTSCLNKDRKTREMLSVRYQQVSCFSKNISRGPSWDWSTSHSA